MVFPLEELIRCKGNMYAITCAATRRAYQLSMLADEELGGYDDKPVSIAERQIFSGEVEFKLDDETYNLNTEEALDGPVE